MSAKSWWGGLGWVFFWLAGIRPPPSLSQTSHCLCSSLLWCRACPPSSPQRGVHRRKCCEPQVHLRLSEVLTGRLSLRIRAVQLSSGPAFCVQSHTEFCFPTTQVFSSLCFLSLEGPQTSLFCCFGFLSQLFSVCPGTPSVGEAGLRVTETCLPLPPQCWEGVHSSARPLFVVLLAYINYIERWLVMFHVCI